MTVASASCLGLALLLASLSIASGQDKGQSPPKEEAKCISESTSYEKTGGDAALVVELQNACERRHRCTVNAYTISAFGARQEDDDTRSKSKGAASKNALVIKVREAGGSTYSTYRCKVL